MLASPSTRTNANMELPCRSIRPDSPRVGLIPSSWRNIAITPTTATSQFESAGLGTNRKVRKSSSRADESFQSDKVHFWFFINSAVADFVDGKILRVQILMTSTGFCPENLHARNLSSFAAIEPTRLTVSQSPIAKSSDMAGESVPRVCGTTRRVLKLVFKPKRALADYHCYQKGGYLFFHQYW